MKHCEDNLEAPDRCRAGTLAKVAIRAFVVIAVAVTALASGGGWALAEGELKVTFLPVTWGDATLYQGPCGELGLIDGSYTASNRKLIADAIEGAGGHLQWIVVSHYDQDHLGNIERLGRKFLPAVVYDRGGTRDAKATKTYHDYFDWLDSGAGPLRHSLELTEEFALCSGEQEVRFSVVSVSSDGVAVAGTPVRSENDKSVCLKVTYGTFDLATCGDVAGFDVGRQRDVETAVAPEFGDVEFARVNHHGSQYSSNSTFVATLSAQASVITGARRQYEHPAPAVEARWNSYGTLFHTTRNDGSNKDGAVIVTTSGHEAFSVTTTESDRSLTFAMDGAAPMPEPVSPVSGSPPPRNDALNTERIGQMLSSNVVDVVVGVMFVFLVFSLVVSGINEVITRLFAWRSRHLWQAVWQLLDGEKRRGTNDPRPVRAGPVGQKWTERLYAHPLILQLERWTPTAKSRLSSIPASDFARAFLDLLVPDEEGPVTVDRVRANLNGLSEGPLKESLLALSKGTGERIEDLLKEIGDWFDARMEALSTSYKSHVKWVLVGIGIVVALVFNVDAIGAAQRLYRDEALRVAVADQAATVVAGCEDQADVAACTREQVAKVDSAIRLPVGWPDPDGIPWIQPLGWLFAGIALGQGAPFWFDLLRKAGKLRR